MSRNCQRRQVFGMYSFRAVKKGASLCGCLQKQNIHQTATHFVVAKNLKGKSKSSQEWLIRQLNDPLVIKSKKDGYRARSAYKLLELDEKFNILRPGLVVVDCGASPGAWSQVVVNKINCNGDQQGKAQGKVIGIDLSYIQPLRGAIFLPNCDFTDPESIKKIIRLVRDEPEEEQVEEEDISLVEPKENKIIDVVLSDMAPNSTGIGDADHYRILKLAKCALNFALEYGKKDGTFLTKIWQGADMNSFIEELKTHYSSVKASKPSATRDKSAEIFICAKRKRI